MEVGWPLSMAGLKRNSLTALMALASRELSEEDFSTLRSVGLPVASTVRSMTTVRLRKRAAGLESAASSPWGLLRSFGGGRRWRCG